MSEITELRDLQREYVENRDRLTELATSQEHITSGLLLSDASTDALRRNVSRWQDQSWAWQGRIDAIQDRIDALIGYKAERRP